MGQRRRLRLHAVRVRGDDRADVLGGEAQKGLSGEEHRLVRVEEVLAKHVATQGRPDPLSAPTHVQHGGFVAFQLEESFLEDQVVAGPPSIRVRLLRVDRLDSPRDPSREIAVDESLLGEHHQRSAIDARQMGVPVVCRGGLGPGRGGTEDQNAEDSDEGEGRS